jgi:GTP1/Obg family GTP-binding protein
MATIEILSWKEDYVGFTGWDDHARTEVAKRLRRAINASPSEIKSLARQIRARQPAVLNDIKDESLASLRQILETMGAELNVSPTVTKP